MDCRCGSWGWLLLVRFVHYGDVVENVLLFFGYLVNVFVDDYGEFVVIGWIVGVVVGDGCC